MSWIVCGVMDCVLCHGVCVMCRRGLCVMSWVVYVVMECVCCYELCVM